MGQFGCHGAFIVYSLKQQLEVAREEDNIRSELQQKITDQHKELNELHQVTRQQGVIIIIIVC